jgi:hypothetical protein
MVVLVLGDMPDGGLGGGDGRTVRKMKGSAPILNPWTFFLRQHVLSNSLNRSDLGFGRARSG